MDCSSPGSYIHGILQARILEWVAMPSSPGDLLTPGLGLHVSYISCTGRWVLIHGSSAYLIKPLVIWNTQRKVVEVDEPEWETRGQTLVSLIRQNVEKQLDSPSPTPTLLEEAEISRCICTRNKATSRHYKGKRCPRKTVAPRGHKEPKKRIKVPTQPTRQHGLPQSARSVRRNKAL